MKTRSTLRAPAANHSASKISPPRTFEWLNYHHLFYFFVVAQEGSIARAGKRLRLSTATISVQLRQLEQSLGEPLLTRQGKSLVLTDFGRLALRYANQIFETGQEFLDVLKGRSPERVPRLTVGIVDAIPKLVAYQLLAPALQQHPETQLVCVEGSHDTLLADLATHTLDVVLADAPLSPSSHVVAFNHMLGECDITFLAAPALAPRAKHNFPQSMHKMPVLLPTRESAFRRSLEAWFHAHKIAPHCVGEFTDSALLKVFGSSGMGVFAVPSIIANTVIEQSAVRLVARVPELRETYYAISVERRVRNPLVMTLCSNARHDLFSSASIAT